MQIPCYRCGTITDTEEFCPHCGANMHAYRRILLSSEALYNEGLDKARVRDLSGAIESLQGSLKFNKCNTKARNLLGLVYYERGEVVEALREWVISQNLAPEDNPAEAYLAQTQSDGALEHANNAIKKYNQALLYCRQNSRDLARIQLRRVVSMNPKLVSAYQLLALLCIQDGEYSEARKALNLANKIDVKNPITLRYQREVKDAMKANEASKKKKRKDVVAFQDGNDTVVMPGHSFREMIDGNRSSLLNILVGLIIGLLICVFLIVPTVQQNAKSQAASNLVEANNEATENQGNVDYLQNQIDSLQEQLQAYSAKGDTVTSYEKLLEAQELYNKGDLTGATTALDQVNSDLLDSRGKAIYDAILIPVNQQRLTTSYQSGIENYNKGNYSAAIWDLTIVINIDSTYEKGAALYYLGDSYLQTNDSDQAVICFNRILDEQTGGTYYSKATDVLKFIGALTDESDAGTTAE